MPEHMDPQHLYISVECDAGHGDEKAPTRFFLGARKVEVVDVVDCWLGADHRYFKVRGCDGSTYILRHDVSENRWELTMFER